MQKRVWRKVRSCLFVLASAVAVAACGGGGGSSSGGNSAAGYTGNTQAAVIDAGTAEEIALGAYGAGELQSGLGIDPTGASMSSLTLAETLSTSLLVEDLAQTVSVSTAMQSEKMPGSCGGWATQSISADAHGNFSGSMNYDNYCSEGATLKGNVTFLGFYDEQANTLEFRMNFNSLTSSMGGEVLTSSGSIFMDMNLGNPYSPQFFEMTMNVTNPVTEEVCRLEGYKMTMTPGTSYDQLRIEGKYYHDKFGYVNISTDPLIDMESGVPQRGKMRFDGAEDSWATLEFTGNGAYRIDASDGTTIEGLL